MKNFKVIGSLIIFLLFGCLLLFFASENINLKKASADSGFDSSWDSGGSSSWDSGSSSSSWDHDSSSSHSHSSSYDGRSGFSDGGDSLGIAIIFSVIFVIFVVGLCIVALVQSLYRNQGKSYYNKPLMDDLLDVGEDKIELLHEYGLSLPFIKQEAYRIYVNIQGAWSNNDIDMAKDCLGDALYNQYKAQLIGLKAKNQRNVMSDFEFIDAKVVNVVDNPNSLLLNVALRVKCKDYLATLDGKVLRGSSSRINDYTYYLGFVVSKEEIELTNCPNCNAKITAKGTSIKCKFCGSNIVRKSHDMVLERKEMVEQR